VAHGVEGEDERIAKGKSPSANITVSAKVNSGNLEVEVRDDGKGIDWARLAEKAGTHMKPGIEMFLAGVSTANEVDELAGRGVGVAAVVEVAKSLGGTVEVESEVNVGSAFKIKVPMSDDTAYAPKPSLPPAALRKLGNKG
jgi:two-component system chemotaxis sensor kinase CheA